MAGMSKENELPDEEKKKAVAEFDFKKGITVAIFSGLMSSAMSFGLQGGRDRRSLLRGRADHPASEGNAGAGGGAAGRFYG